MSGPRVVVVGSLNMDLVVRAPEFPRAGATVLGAAFQAIPGGKGANQAAAAARLGASVTLVGALGRDAWGDALHAELRRDAVELEHVARLDEHATGVGVITVVPSGENAILVASGANHALTSEHVDEARAALADADAVLLQNEVPREVNRRALELARAGSKETRVCFNAAPADDVDPELLAAADVVVVNREEALDLCGGAQDEDFGPAGAARRIAALGPGLVAVTLGAEGAVLFDGEELLREAAPIVDAVDTVGAGDAFVAALAVELADGGRLADSLRLACAAGAAAATVEGALPSMPDRGRLTDLLG